MPKHIVTLNIKQYIREHEFGSLDEAIENIIEYAPDWGFPDNVDQESIQEDFTSYNFDGTILTLSFDFEITPEEDDEPEDLDDNEQGED